MIGKSGKFTEGGTLEDCLQISIKALGRSCRKSGYSLGQIVSLWTDPSSNVGEVSGTMTWSKTDKWTGETQKTGEIRYSVGSDSEGVYLELSYSWKYDRETEYREERYRYYLIAKESNLKPGTYRYYFLDPYSEKDPGLCTKLYLYRGIFYPRSVLQSYGVLYKQQREGHTQRYVWTFYHRVPEYESMRYRKSHDGYFVSREDLPGGMEYESQSESKYWRGLNRDGNLAVLEGVFQKYRKVHYRGSLTPYGDSITRHYNQIRNWRGAIDRSPLWRDKIKVWESVIPEGLVVEIYPRYRKRFEKKLGI